MTKVGDVQRNVVHIISADDASVATNLNALGGVQEQSVDQAIGGDQVVVGRRCRRLEIVGLAAIAGHAGESRLVIQEGWS